MTIGTGNNLGELEYSWYSSRSGLSEGSINDHKRAYYISEIGARGSSTPLSQLEQEWLGTLSGVTSEARSDRWREAVVGAGLTPETTILANKIKYYSNVS